MRDATADGYDQGIAMKLMIGSSNPSRGSYKDRIGRYVGHLEAAGIDVTEATLPGRRNGRLRRAFFARGRDFDAVLLHKKLLNIPHAFWARRYFRRMIYVYDDAVCYNPVRPGRLSWSRTFAFRRTCRLADHIIVGSRYLADLARPVNAAVTVLPLGLPTSLYGQRTSRPENDTRVRLVWIGSAATTHYLAALRPCLEQLGREFPNVCLRMIGDTFIDLESMPVEKIVWSPETRYSGLSESDIGLAPLPGNPFTEGKCSFKVLEYSASGLPLVASPVGTNREHVVHGTTGFLAETPGQWGPCLRQLIADRDLRNSMGEAGRRHAQTHDVEVIGERLAALIKGVVQP